MTTDKARCRNMQCKIACRRKEPSGSEHQVYAEFDVADGACEYIIPVDSFDQILENNKKILKRLKDKQL